MPELMETCQRNNSAMNVTGILHDNGNAFLQVPEGGLAEVSSIYQRMFPTWSMGRHEGMDDKTKQIVPRSFASNIVNPETVG